MMLEPLQNFVQDARFSRNGQYLLVNNGVADQPLNQNYGGPNVKPVLLNGQQVNLPFGPSPEEAGVLAGRALPTDAKLTCEQFVLNGRFSIDDAFRLEGSAQVTMPDNTQGRVDIIDGRIEVEYLDERLVLPEIESSSLLVKRGTEAVNANAIYNQLRQEASSQGFAALSTTSRAVIMISALFHAPDVIRNGNVVKAYEACQPISDDTDYGWWCEATAYSGALAIGVLGVVGCAALLAGCVGTVVLDGLGVVSCVAANIICGTIFLGLAALVDIIKRLVWGNVAA